VSKVEEYNSTMAVAACNKLFETYPAIKKADIDLLIFASAGQDILEPATSHIVQKEIGTNCPVFDVTNACNSFINALQIADAFIKNNTYKNILIATGEVSTKSAKIAVTDRDDFKQSFPGYTFGDGGTAVVVSVSNTENNGIVDFSFTANSDYWDTAIMAGGGSRYMGNSDQYFRGSGHELKIAFDTIGPDFVKSFLKKHSLKAQDITHVFVHQVSLPYLQDFMKGCEFNDIQVEQTISWCGNVAAASLPLAWSLRSERNELKSGDRVLLIGLAGGISLGVALVQI
jgi:acyl-CoA:acyl-CoA alkyltransferase